MRLDRLSSWLDELFSRRDAPGADPDAPVLVAYGSQTGGAIQLAWATAKALQSAGVQARVLALSRVEAADLQGTGRALFITSTYGEGEPPDNAAAFERRWMHVNLPLRSLGYGLLALGDRQYADFCAFGRRLDAWLQAQGALPLFARVEADGDDEAALHAWQQGLSRLAGPAVLAGWRTPGFEPWRLLRRDWLNRGSSGGPTFHLELTPAHGPLPHWEAGDLVQVRVPGDERRPREYSIASIPQDGRLHLLVRLERTGDGTPGLASGWLGEQLPLQETLPLRVRANATFRLGDNAGRPLILVGNGTGLAGLLSLLKARIARGERRHWLLFGERHRACDFYHRDRIESWVRAGCIERLNLAFSRDQPERVYVQHLLARQADRLRGWIADGAAVYVCGSLQGMAGEVDAVLRQVLGDEGVQALAAEGRYRRDVY